MKLKVSIGVGLVGCTREDEIEIEEDEIEGMSPEEKEDYFEELWRCWMNNYLDGYWEIIE